MDHSVTEPLRRFARRRDLGPQQVYDWDKQGLIKTVLIGNRRHVIVASYDAFIRRLVKEQAGARLPSSNPKAKKAATTAPAAPARKRRAAS
jgi:hypothetical protein